FSTMVRKFRPINQESTIFYEDHELFDDEEVDIRSTDGGKRIAAAIGGAKAVILRNHGLLTVGTTVASCVGLFIAMERVAEVHMKSPDAVPIGHEAASTAAASLGQEAMGWHGFQYLVRTYIDDPTVVESQPRGSARRP